MKPKIPIILLGVYLVAFVICAIAPYDRAVWVAENAPIVILVGVLAWIYRHHKYTPLSCVLMFCLIVLHTIGGHYTFERVPFGWVTDTFGFSRNHYDRVCHFTVGFYAYPLAELLLVKKQVNARWVLFAFPLCAIIAVAGAYEVFEWIYSITAEDAAGTAVLGSQGDMWDAQKDILADTLGALFALGLFAVIWRGRLENPDAPGS